MSLCPGHVTSCAARLEKMDALEAGSQDLVPAVAIPVQDLNAMDDCQRVINQVRRPGVPIELACHNVAAQVRLRHFKPGERCADRVVWLPGPTAQEWHIHKGQWSGTSQVGPAQAVRGGDLSNLAQRPFRLGGA